MSKINLKSALEKLDISKPLKLTSDAPRFKEPETKVAKVSLDAKVPEDSFSSVEISAVETPKIQRASYPRAATEQDASVRLHNQSESKLRNGFTRIPNDLLMELIEGDLSKSEMKIALLITRMTISFQRELAPLSKAVIERITKLQGRSVLEAVSALESKKLIVKKPGDAYTPNQLGIPGARTILGWNTTEGENMTKDTKPSEGKDVKHTKPVDENLPTPAGSNSPYFKLPQTNSNELFNDSLPVDLKNYFQGLRAPKKRESEWSSFLEIQKTSSHEEIAACLKLLRKRGVPGSGEPCHSPMAFLTTAMDVVLSQIPKTVRTTTSTNAASPTQNRVSIERAAFEESGEKIETWIELARLKFPNASPSGPAIEALAIGCWWEENHQN